MADTFATVIIKAEHVELARELLGQGFFISPLSETGELPVTHYCSSGYWNTENELEFIINESPFPKIVKFGEVFQSIEALNLKIVTIET